MKKINVLTVLLFTMMFVIGSLQAATPVAYWPFDDGTGTDATGNGADGVLASPVAVAGYQGGALEFDGDDEVEIATGASLDGATDFSVSAWIRTTSTANGTVIQQRDESGDGWNGQYALRVNGDGFLTFYIYNGGYGFNFTGVTAVNDGEWHHVVAVKTGADGTTYVDGALDTTGTGGEKSLAGAIKVGIACDIRDNGAYFVGTIDEVYVFDVALTQQEIDQLYYMDKALLVGPAYGATLQPITTVLEWAPPVDYTITGYDVYFGADPNFGNNPQVVINDPATTYAPTLAYDTTYFWRVDSTDDSAELHEGVIWSFTTAPEYPLITVEPQSVTVAGGETAIFTIEAITTDSYQWYYTEDGTTASPISGATTSVLTLPAVTQVDEGYYYCEAIGTEAVASATVRLMTERLVANWTFDGDLTDSVAGWDGTLTDPNVLNPNVPVMAYADGVDGTPNGAGLFVRNPLYVSVEGSGEFFNFFPQGQTVSFWAKPDSYDGLNGYMTFVTKRTAEAGWRIHDTAFYAGQGLELTMQPLFSNPPMGRLDDDQWHMITVSYNPETEELNVYQEGQLQATVVGEVVAGSDTPITMGGNTGGGWGYNGLLDDVKIWNYALDPYNVAQLYTDVTTDETICVSPVEYDFNNNCKVDLGDFAIFAQTWLNCNSVAGANSGQISCN